MILRVVKVALGIPVCNNGDNRLQIIFLGGLEEIGNSSLLLEGQEDALLFDFGKGFGKKSISLYPDIDKLYPYIPKLRALLLTHGHEDHTGGCPFFLDEFSSVPVFASQETIDFVTTRNRQLQNAAMRPLQEGVSYRFGSFEVVPFAVSHSIPGALGYCVFYADKAVIIPGDFCFDKWPQVNEEWCSNISRLTSGKKRLLVLDSTNSTRPERVISEDAVAQEFSRIFELVTGRVFASCFSSNLQRIDSLLTAAVQAKMAVYVEGPAMQSSLLAGKKSGRKQFQSAPFPEFFDTAPCERALVLLSGSQGEVGSMMHKLSTRSDLLCKQDAVLLSSQPVPGNEERVFEMLDRFALAGVELFISPAFPVHASGHASRAEISYCIETLQPDFVVPAHGSPFMRNLAAHVVNDCGLGEEQLLLPGTGDTVCWQNEMVTIVPDSSKKTEAALAQSERALLADSGIVFAVLPRQGRELGRISLTVRGFFKQGRKQSLLDEAVDLLEGSAHNALYEGVVATTALRDLLKKELEQFFDEKFGVVPVVVVQIIEVAF